MDANPEQYYLANGAYLSCKILIINSVIAEGQVGWADEEGPTSIGATVPLGLLRRPSLRVRLFISVLRAGLRFDGWRGTQASPSQLLDGGINIIQQQYQQIPRAGLVQRLGHRVVFIYHDLDPAGAFRRGAFS